ncbi:MAG: magnesium transporter CorA family protein [Planctomycetes bacterium]|nr:magnesium transporter CorA family protein [Planctomycetota bacterium]
MNAAHSIATAVSMNFAAKRLTDITPADAQTEMLEDRFVWIDVNLERADEARRLISSLDLCPPEVLEDAFTRDPATQIGRYEDCLHLALTGCRLTGRAFDLERVDAVIGERFMLTLRRGPTEFMNAVHRDFRGDFMRFAQSPSFLLYELWESLIDNYLRVHEAFEARVESIQRALSGDVEETIFQEVSELSSDLLQLRKVVLPARSVLTELATRKSAFVSEATQPYLANMAGTVDRVLQDVLVDRDILSDSLNNYMSMVAHRTNKVMSKLTVVSVIFLPLSFLCGVYGMNFEVLPELKWSWGYGAFWSAVAVIVATLLVMMRRAKVL